MLFDLYKRWRHTRGFGVHSPFAYRLVTEGVRPARGYVYHAELLPGMTPLRRIAFRLRTILRSNGYQDMVYDAAEWEADPAQPLFLVAPTPQQTERIEHTLSNRGCGLMLHSRRYIFAIARKEMALVRYNLL